MSVDVNVIFEKGGRDLIDFLEYCVLGVKKDILFLYLAREYRLRPTAAGAVALHDVFCTATAPARISAAHLLAPKDMRLDQSVHPYRQNILEKHRIESTGGEDDEQRNVPPLLPPRHLFDPLVHQLISGSDSVLSEVQQHYNPALTPHENLPGGKLNAGQRAFVENIWTPLVRPHLVAAGYWRIATVA